MGLEWNRQQKAMFMTSRVDYFNSLYLGIKPNRLREFQLVQNAPGCSLTNTGPVNSFIWCFALLMALNIESSSRFFQKYKAFHGIEPYLHGRYLFCVRVTITLYGNIFYQRHMASELGRQNLDRNYTCT